MATHSLIDLATIEDKQYLTHAIAAHLPSIASGPIASTALTIAEIQRLSDEESPPSSFSPTSLYLLPEGVQLPTKQVRETLLKLAVSAQGAAEALACSSVLAGQGSESDDTGDVALWLGHGDFGRGHAQNVIEKLGLVDWLGGAQLSDVLLSTRGGLPSTIALDDGGAAPEVEDLVEQLGALGERYCFRAQAPTTGGIVMFFLLGRIGKNETAGWGGLIGLGTWS